MTAGLVLFIVGALALAAAVIEGEVAAHREYRKAMRDRAQRLKDAEQAEHGSDYYGRTP